MAISFGQIVDTRVPGTRIEIDNSQALSGLSLTNDKILVIAQKTSTGTATADTMVLVGSKEQAQELAGVGSQGDLMFKNMFLNDPYTEKWAIFQDDNGAGVASTESVVLSGPATANGIMSFYYDAITVSVAVSKGDTADEIADLVVSEYAKYTTNFPFAVTKGATDTLVFTAKNKGTLGNDIRIYINGDFGTSAFPAGITSDVVGKHFELASGATDPNIATAIAVIPDEIYNYIACGYNDTTNVDLLRDELERRFDGMVQLEGHGVVGKSGTVSTVGTYGNGYNSENFTIKDAGYLSPSPFWMWASAQCGVISRYGGIDPARPFQTLPLLGVVSSAQENRRSETDQNTLLHDGIATHMVDRTGAVLVQRAITTYQTNPVGAPDISYLDVNTPLTISRLRQTGRNFINLNWPRTKIVDDGNVIPAGSATVTPSIVKGKFYELANLWYDAGWIENVDVFMEEIIIERDQSDPTSLNIVINPDLVNQLRRVNVKLQFKL